MGVNSAAIIALFNVLNVRLSLLIKYHIPAVTIGTWSSVAAVFSASRINRRWESCSFTADASSSGVAFFFGMIRLAPVNPARYRYRAMVI